MLSFALGFFSSVAYASGDVLVCSGNSGWSTSSVTEMSSGLSAHAGASTTTTGAP